MDEVGDSGSEEENIGQVLFSEEMKDKRKLGELWKMRKKAGQGLRGHSSIGDERR